MQNEFKSSIIISARLTYWIIIEKNNWIVRIQVKGFNYEFEYTKSDSNLILICYAIATKTLFIIFCAILSAPPPNELFFLNIMSLCWKKPWHLLREKIWGFSELENFIRHKSLISEEWIIIKYFCLHKKSTQL